MKAYFSVKNSFAVAIILLLVVIISGCNATRYLNEDQALVKTVTLKGIDKQYEERVYSYVQKDIRPNSRFNLALYNTFNTRKGKYRTDKVKKIGEAPNLLDSTLVEISRNEIKKYLQTKGFFKADVKSDIEVKNKKAYITFTAERGPMFRVRNFTYTIADSGVKKLYELNRPAFTKIGAGKRYDADSVLNEINSIYNLMKQNGYYDFERQYTHVNVDSNLYSSQADLALTIYNPPGKDHHTVYTLDKSFITITGSDGNTAGKPDTAIIDSQYVFKDYSRKFREKIIKNYLFLNKGDVYNVDNERLTSNRLYDLNVFKNLKIDYVKAADSVSLKPSVMLIPLKRMSNRIEGEYTFNSGRNGFNIGNTYTNRNLLGGAEQLEVKLRYGVLFDSGVTGRAFDHVFNSDLQLGATLTLPRLLVPFRTPVLSKNGLPHTILSSSLQIFDQLDAFRNRIFINSLTYDWVETRYKLHSLTPVNIEYRRGKLNADFKKTLLDSGYVLYVITNDRSYVNLGSQYSYTYNGIRLATLDNFVYVKASADVGGNTLSLLSKAFNVKKVNGVRSVFGQQYLQYAKGEIDLRYYRSFGTERQFIARINPGIGYPYGNSKELPFEKNFYAGGSSGLRAWQARTLGPGQYNRAAIADIALRKSLRNLDQLGEIKLEGNLEYRFKIANNLLGAKLKGATFTDFGNVWRLPTDSLAKTNHGGEFKFNKFLGQLAIGAGAGLRFDLDYFVLRFDMGVKIRDPQFIDPRFNESPWVIKNLFDQKAFKDRYSQTNSPDIYRFVQYNFGIGMPF